MSSVRTSRTRLLTTAAALAIGALSLTACDDGSGVRAEDASPSTSSTASPSASPGSGSSSQDDAKTGADAKPTADGTPAPGNGKTGSGGSRGSGGSHKSGGKAVTCQGSNTKTVAAPLNRPVNHMLLTVTNTGDSNCYLYTYPAVQFGEAQSVPPVIEASKPQAVVTLAPGE
ncbi:DUF4232 domain-containing protein, partial [Streptomyces hygroscopicus]|uniref:DUF4232 domain-containing protein n=1 Tax=Streptomyces hygroscopicus TaxID=1912 RepID=UPI0036B77A28